MGTSGESQIQFYRKPLPDMCISFSSKEGRNIFREALASGYMECYFGLASQFRTQDEPAYCGLASLVMVLNALEIDPKRLWKGVWRWYHEDMLSCGIPLEEIKKFGINMDQFACLAGCNSLDVKMIRATESWSEEKFREDVIRATQSEETYMVASYFRQKLGQSGTGHFAPIGGYHPNRDLVLVLDTARFKYPPHWVALSDLYNAMKDVDDETSLPRGYFLLKRSGTSQLVLFGISQYLLAAVDNRKKMSDGIQQFIEAWNGWNCDAAGDDVNMNTVVEYAFEKLMGFLKILDGNEYLIKCDTKSCPNSLSKEHKLAIEELLDALRNTDIYKTVNKLLKHRKECPVLKLKAGNVRECCYMSVERDGGLLEVEGHCGQLSFGLTPEDFIAVLLLLWPYGKCEGTNGNLLRRAVELTLTTSEPVTKSTLTSADRHCSHLACLFTLNHVLGNEINMMHQQVQSLLGYLAHCNCANQCGGSTN